MIVNKIGLEAEFFVRDNDGNLIYPQTCGFESDDFCILGEFRAEPGVTREETIGNFMKAYYAVIYKAEKRGVTIDIKDGYSRVDPILYSDILRKTGTKIISNCKNIYDLDILELTDSEVRGSKVVAHKISCGLHIHFSSMDVKTFKYRHYVPVGTDKVQLFKEDEERKVVSEGSRITKPVVEYIVETLDNDILKSCISGMPKLKYRNAGFYEDKTWGIEYRSLPFNQKVLEKIHTIVDASFLLLESL